jgi:hypothetical protein
VTGVVGCGGGAVTAGAVPTGAGVGTGGAVAPPDPSKLVIWWLAVRSLETGLTSALLLPAAPQ